jgi:hypothetical protein
MSVTFESLFKDTAAELFRSLGLEITATGIDAPPGEVLAVISFASPRERGTIVLEVSPGIFAARQGADPAASLAEVTNQLMGRLKNRLLAFGVELSMTLPVTVSGKGLEPGLAGGVRPLTWRFSTGHASAWLQSSLTGELTPALEQVEVLREGRGVLF